MIDRVAPKVRDFEDVTRGDGGEFTKSPTSERIIVVLTIRGRTINYDPHPVL